MYRTNINEAINDYLTVRVLGYRPVKKKFAAHKIYAIENDDEEKKK